MSATLPSCSGAFFRLHCRHELLFDKEYKRSNRNRGTKILRCFPHCCPSHVERSYCGSSLELAVDLHQPLQSASAQSLFVFARFEVVDFDETLRIGQHCSLRYLTRMSQCEANPEGPWIHGVLQNSGGSTGPSTRVFLLNGHTSSKWYYHWESGANKARRLTKHLLKAYILYRRPVSQSRGDATVREHGEDLIQVIGSVCSPPFTLVSYRRFTWEGLETTEAGSSPMEQDAPTDYARHEIVRNQIEHAQLQQTTHSSSAAPPTQRQAQRHIGEYLGTKANVVADDQTVAGTVRAENQDEPLACESCEQYQHKTALTVRVQHDQWGWERRHSGLNAHLKDLAIIYCFVSHVPADVVLQSSRSRHGMSVALKRHWWSQFTDDDQPRLTPELLLSRLSPRQSDTRDASTSSAAAPPMDAHAEELVLAATKLWLWLLGDENRDELRSFFDVHAGVLLDKPRLRDAYLHGASLVCKRVHGFWLRELMPPSQDTFASRDAAVKSIHAFGEQIIALAHREPPFQGIWTDLRAILEEPGLFLWESFVAQARETHVRKHMPSPLSATDLQAVSSGFNGAWALDASTLAIHPSSSNETPQLSIDTVLQGMAQLLQLTLRVTSDATLIIRHENSALPAQNPWMVLICDSQPRVVSVLPLGFSSLLGAHSFGGDYVCTISPSGNRISVTLYWWPLPCRSKWSPQTSSSQASRVRLSLHRVSDKSRASMQVSIDVQHGVVPKREQQRARHLTRLELWSARERIALHVAWESVWRATAVYEQQTC